MYLYLFRKWTRQTMSFSLALFFSFYRVFSINTYLYETKGRDMGGKQGGLTKACVLGILPAPPLLSCYLLPPLTPRFLRQGTLATAFPAPSAPSWSHEERTRHLPPPLLSNSPPFLRYLRLKKEHLTFLHSMHFSVARLMPFPSSPWSLGNHILPFPTLASPSSGPCEPLLLHRHLDAVISQGWS